MHSFITPRKGYVYPTPHHFAQQARPYGLTLGEGDFIHPAGRDQPLGRLIPAWDRSGWVLADLTEVNPLIEARAVTPPPKSALPDVWQAHPAWGVMVRWGDDPWTATSARPVEGEAIASRGIVPGSPWEGEVERLEALLGDGEYATEFGRVLAAMGWSRRVAAQVLDVSSGNRVSDWARGERELPGYIQRSLEGWVRLWLLGVRP